MEVEIVFCFTSPDPNLWRMMRRLGLPALELCMQKKKEEMVEMMLAETLKPNCPKWYKKSYAAYAKAEEKQRQEECFEVKDDFEYQTMFEHALGILNPGHTDCANLTEQHFAFAKELLAKHEARSSPGVAAMRSAYELKLDQFVKA